MNKKYEIKCENITEGKRQIHEWIKNIRLVRIKYDEKLNISNLRKRLS